jgi:toxin HigB-1
LIEPAPTDGMFIFKNRFEALGGVRVACALRNRKGQYSIRINDKWRICFEWSDQENHPFNIEIVNYH